jgi:hypothetical protein
MYVRNRHACEQDDCLFLESLATVNALLRCSVSVRRTAGFKEILECLMQKEEVIVCMNALKEMSNATRCYIGLGSLFWPIFW